MSTFCEIECNKHRISKRLKWPQPGKFHLNSTTCTSFMKTKACLCVRLPTLENRRPVDHIIATGDRSSLFESWSFTCHRGRTMSHLRILETQNFSRFWYIINTADCDTFDLTTVQNQELNEITSNGRERLTWNLQPVDLLLNWSIKACLGARLPWSSDHPVMVGVDKMLSRLSKQEAGGDWNKTDNNH